MKLTLKTEAEFKAFAAAEDRELNNNRRFFQNNRDRSFLIRRAFYAEEQRVRFLDRDDGTFDGKSVFVAVHQVKADFRLRSFFTGPFLMKTVTAREEEARAIFIRVAPIDIVTKVYLAVARSVGRA